MTPDLLHRVGHALYGATWVPELSRVLKINIRTIRRWADGINPIPDWLLSSLADLCVRQSRELDALAGELRAQARAAERAAAPTASRLREE